MASLHKNRRTTLERIDKFISPLYFSDVNLHSRLYDERRSIDVYHWALPVGASWKDFPFVVAVDSADFKPVAVGEAFGPTWATHWFKIVATVPDEWVGEEVHLRWNSGSEALLFDEGGRPLQGFTGCPDHQKREEFVVSPSWHGGPSQLVYYIEMACNDMFGAGKGCMIAPPDPGRQFPLQLAELAVLNRRAYGLKIDLELLHDMADGLTEELGRGDSRGYQALYTANEMINNIQRGQVENAEAMALEFFSVANGGRAHQIDAMGHCHIDTAWLWPFDETIRKCARSWSSVITLMKQFPDFTFVCSQAQQFAWVKQYYPSLYEEIKHYVSLGRFIPVGSTWIEMDGNIPSGESFIRQFLYGQRFYEREFGIKCKEFWLPDTFGYSAQTPQIMKHVGISRFLTQKLSWNLVNKFPNHNFWWQGLDGSEVLVHFPPGDSYEANCKVAEALKTERNLLDKGRVTNSVMLFGFGDGGGGPHRPMLERLRRLKDVDGLPKMRTSSPDQFFEKLESQGANLCRWVGELYLELHNGTYTSQADMKKGNRRCELTLRDADLLVAVCAARGLVPAQELQSMRGSLAECWRLLMVNQFHDVLPGSSIEIVHKEAKEMFARCLHDASGVVQQCLRTLPAKPTGERTTGLLNTLSWRRLCLEYADGDSVPVGAVELDPMSLASSRPVDVPDVQCHDRPGGGFTITNRHFTVQVDPHGRLVSLVRNGQETIRPGHFGNQLVLYDDIPLYWDAWDCMDYHLETRRPVNGPALDDCTPAKVVLHDRLKVSVEWEVPVGVASRVVQRMSVTGVGEFVEFESWVRWAENRKFLKVEWPLNLHCQQARFDTQFGFLSRATHKNTSWDSARFEVCGHKWADMCEANFGAAVLNDSKYGWSALGSTLSLSLLRSPKMPDATCDMHQHYFRYAIMPHDGLASTGRVVRTAYEFNCPPLTVPGPAAVAAGSAVRASSWFRVLGGSSDLEVVLDTVKLGEPITGPADERTRIVIRLFEACGGRLQVTIETCLPVVQVEECDGLEQVKGTVLLERDAEFTRFKAAFTPFQVRSFMLTV